MIIAQEFKKGQFTYVGSDGANHTVPIDFNPATLEYSITINAQGEGGQTQQAAGAASAKLTLELLFDTTDTGDDVRTKTSKVEAMLRPQAAADARPNAPREAPPMVTFEWGAFKFVGIVDSFKQTMDFFAPNGIPLRASVSLTMSQPDYQFDQQGAGKKANVDQPLVLPDGNPSQLASDAGNPFAARLIASVNGLESLRFSAGASIAVGGGVSIGAPAGFASAGASAGIGVGIGVGGSLGLDASIGFGAGASAGVSASAGAFGGLHASAGSASATSSQFISPDRLLATTSAPGVAPGALFDVTGKAVAQSASTFKTDVGATRRLRFDES